jgi:hypothetical protein
MDILGDACMLQHAAASVCQSWLASSGRLPQPSFSTKRLSAAASTQKSSEFEVAPSAASSCMIACTSAAAPTALCQKG